MTQYLCCIHCGPGCPNNDEHDLACPKGCMPYARQKEDENMSDNETENIAATALEEILEFEREQWKIERTALTEENLRLAALVRTFDDFIFTTTQRLAAALYIAEDDDAMQVFRHFFMAYLDDMPTPSKMDMEEHLDMHHDDEAQIKYAVDALGSRLVDLGIDPDDVIAEKQKADEDFIKTLIHGFNTEMSEESLPTDDEIERDEDPDS